MYSSELIGLAGELRRRDFVADVRFAKRFNKAPHRDTEHMRTYEANGAGDRLHIDLMGPHPVSRQGHVYIFTAIDAYTRYLVAVPLRNKSTVTVANALVEHVFLPHGAYRSIVSDQRREFCNEVLDEVTRLLGVEKLRTSAYRASANGRVERVHRTMNALLSKVVSENQRDWAERLPMVIVAYRCEFNLTQFL
jgi:transposase InsO family protein